MQSNLLIFFYLLSFVLFVPVVVIGSTLKKGNPKPKPKKPPTPEEVLEGIQKSREDLFIAKKNFEKFFLESSRCDQELWFKIIEEFARSKWLETKEVSDFQEKIKNANPKLQKEITLTIGTALKNRK